MQQKKETRRPFVEHWQVVKAMLVIYDVISIAAAYFIALLLRFDFHYSEIPYEYLSPYKKYIPFYIVICVIIYAGMRLYRSIWRFASYDELLRVVKSTGLCVLVHAAFAITVRMPISYYLMGITLQFGFTIGIRFAYRFILLLRSDKYKKSHKVKNVLVIGAGKSGSMVIRELNTTKHLNDEPRCVIDDNPNKWGRFIDGVLVFGGRDRILEAVDQFNIDKIYLAIPSVSPQIRRDILNICKETDCELKSLPGIYQIANGEVSLSKMRKVEIEDLLGRDPIKVNLDDICSYIEKNVVLITGGGGSIGSELCRQVAAHNPKQLIIFDIYENNAYDIQQELIKKYPDLNLVTLIGSVRDNRRIFQVFEQYHPNIVFHAAAHKHVPLMEGSPCEAVKNNVIGTYNTAFAAMIHNVDKFVLISTDKAVNPCNIMGATKRLCEMIVQAFDHLVKTGKADEAPQLFCNPILKKWASTPEKDEQLRQSKTEFVAVRFGNVLGSNGSVIPLFKKQILAGGPVTVTHPDIIRYFMTIPEAVSLVLQAGCYAHGGEIFVLDMGEPVKIDTLARNLIRLSGLKPDVDIKIEYTGLRPGEKLYEEKLMAEEGLEKTDNELIHIGKPIPFDVEWMLDQLEPLMDAAYKNKDYIRDLVADLVSTYQITDENRMVKGAQ